MRFFEEINVPVKLPLKRIALRNETCLYIVFSIRNDINLDHSIFLVFREEEHLIAAIVGPFQRRREFSIDFDRFVEHIV